MLNGKTRARHYSVFHSVGESLFFSWRGWLLFFSLQLKCFFKYPLRLYRYCERKKKQERDEHDSIVYTYTSIVIHYICQHTYESLTVGWWLLLGEFWMTDLFDKHENHVALSDGALFFICYYRTEKTWVSVILLHRKILIPPLREIVHICKTNFPEH